MIEAFTAWLTSDGWTVERRLDFCDVVAHRGTTTLNAEAKGRTAAVGLDVDTLYGPLLRRADVGADGVVFGVVVPVEARAAALRVPEATRRALGPDVEPRPSGERARLDHLDACDCVRRRRPWSHVVHRRPRRTPLACMRRAATDPARPRPARARVLGPGLRDALRRGVSLVAVPPQRAVGDGDPAGPVLSDFSFAWSATHGRGAGQCTRYECFMGEPGAPGKQCGRHG